MFRSVPIYSVSYAVDFRRLPNKKWIFFSIKVWITNTVDLIMKKIHLSSSKLWEFMFGSFFLIDKEKGGIKTLARSSSRRL